MIYINRKNYPCPDSLLNDGSEETNMLTDHFINEREVFLSTKSEVLFKKTIYASDDVKQTLILSQNGKCAFCESSIHEVSYSHVEHFRPKAGWKSNHHDHELKKPGYFKEAYIYDNLLLACGVCNIGNKQNYFPLQYEDVRTAISDEYDCNLETPLLINPILIDPNDHIDFYEEIPLGKSLQGSVTIEYFGLDRQPLSEKRLEKFNLLRGYKEIIDDDPNNQKAKDIFRRQLNDTIENNRTYVAMVVANFKEYLEDLN